MKQGILYVALVMLTLMSPVNAVAPRITGIYSNLQYNEEGGDLLGMEMLAVPSRSESGFSAVIQIAEGGAPSLSVVPLDVRGTRIAFTIPADAQSYGGKHFVGEISSAGITGHWDEGVEGPTGEKVEHLKRGKSYWE